MRSGHLESVVDGQTWLPDETFEWYYSFPHGGEDAEGPDNASHGSSLKPKSGGAQGLSGAFPCE